MWRGDIQEEEHIVNLKLNKPQKTELITLCIHHICCNEFWPIRNQSPCDNARAGHTAKLLQPQHSVQCLAYDIFKSIFDMSSWSFLVPLVLFRMCLYSSAKDDYLEIKFNNKNQIALCGG